MMKERDGHHPIPAAALDDRLGPRFRFFVVDNLIPAGLMRPHWGSISERGAGRPTVAGQPTAVRLAPRSFTILAVGAVIYDRCSKRHVVEAPR